MIRTGPSKELQPVQSSRGTSEVRKGFLYGITAYVVWGFFPLFFKQLVHVAPLQVLAHRITWSLLTLLIFIFVSHGRGKVRSAFRNRQTISILGATTLLIALNWFVFILAVNRNQVLQSSFGYFINPLVSAMLGVIFLRERLNRLQLLSITFAGIGVLILALHQNAIPWIALVLAFTFGLYGLLRKIVQVEALTGLFVETLLLFPAAACYLVVIGATGRGAFLTTSLTTTSFLLLAGFITALPLLWFAASARRLRLVTVGFMQYITPSIHFILAVFVFREPFDCTEMGSFAFIWAGLGLYSFNAARSAFKARTSVKI